MNYREKLVIKALNISRSSCDCLHSLTCHARNLAVASDGQTDWCRTLEPSFEPNLTVLGFQRESHKWWTKLRGTIDGSWFKMPEILVKTRFIRPPDWSIQISQKCLKNWIQNDPKCLCLVHHSAVRFRQDWKSRWKLNVWLIGVWPREWTEFSSHINWAHRRKGYSIAKTSSRCIQHFLHRCN